jgi:hypothetical protein
MFFLPITCLNNIYHVKIQLFVTLKSDQNPDPIGSALVFAPRIRIWIRIEINSWIRIRIETNADP